MKYIDELTTIGMTKDQASVYETLLSSLVLPVRIIAQKSGISRELTYVVLDQLIEKGFIEKIDGETKVALYRALHPETIHSLVSTKKRKADEALLAYEQILSEMSSEFNAVRNRPHVKFFEGLNGLTEIYKDIIASTKTIYVFRSIYDYNHEAIRLAVSDQITKQSEAGIRSYVISPKLPHMSEVLYKHNLKRNITRKIIPVEKFSLPAQIVIYGNKVGITSFRKEVSTTIIENADISETFLKLFQYVWDSIEESR
jgi:sugar-specific transcriptional regulator TrmB